MKSLKKIIFFSFLYLFSFYGLSVQAMQQAPRSPEMIIRTLVSAYLINKESAYKELEKINGKAGYVIYAPEVMRREVAHAPFSIRDNHGLLYADWKLFWINIAQEKINKVLPFMRKSTVSALAFVACENENPMILVGHDNGDIIRVEPNITGLRECFGKVDGHIHEIVANKASCMIVVRYSYSDSETHLQRSCAAMSIPYKVRELKTNNEVSRWSKFLCMKCDDNVTAINFDDVHCITTFYNGQQRKWAIKSPRHNPYLVED